jgi:rfaE bifunctional protein nucleotidyltransferase chain/domain
MTASPAAQAKLVPVENEAPSMVRARDKVQPLDAVADIAASARLAGRTVVLAHGVFDILHVGHLRHLEAAAAEGDILIVSITGDAYVNKGPERPAFTEQLRAEMVAGLEYVDWVAVNHHPSSENVISLVRPDVYVKGVEYAAADSDITGKISSERESIEAYGGRVIFTEDITFSSSALINRYLDVYGPSTKDYLARARGHGMLERFTTLLDKVRNYRVLFVGDSIIDEYQYVRPMGKSPKDNMIATLFQERELFAGGVIAAANHVAGFCAEVEVVTSLGEGAEGFEDFIRSSLKPNVRLTPIVRPSAPTTRKCRFIDTGYDMRKLFEIYFMDDRPVRGDVEQRLVDVLGDRIADFDLVIVTDFGHGMMSDAVVRCVSQKAGFLAVNAQTNSANLGFNLITKYGRADYVCIDQPEARLAVADNHADLESVVSTMLPQRMSCPRIIVTRGKHGCLTYHEEEGLGVVPALASGIVDTVGAGDAFFAVSAPFVRAGATMAEAGFIGNAAGAVKVGIVGHRHSVEKIPYMKFVTSLLK